jgi:hypothetical protein
MPGFPEPPASSPAPGVVEHARVRVPWWARKRRGVHSIWWGLQSIAAATHPTAWVERDLSTTEIFMTESNIEKKV